MLLWIVLTSLLAGAIAIVLTLKTLRPADAVALGLKVARWSGIFALFNVLGMRDVARPKLVEVKSPNGNKMLSAGYLIGGFLDVVHSFKTREDDVFLATYPKAGTTWIQEITWLICNNAETVAAKKEPVTKRSPFLEAVDLDPSTPGIQTLEKWPRDKQRIMKTHLPYELLPEEVIVKKKGKIICVARNPKDLCVSYYHFHIMNAGLPKPGPWNEFLTKFCSGNMAWGSWFHHTLRYWQEHRDNGKQIYFTTFEALKKDLRSEVASVARFLEKELTEDQIDKIAAHCTFDSMSKNKQTNYNHAEKLVFDFKKSKFMRKGQVGDWKNYFTLNQNTAFDELYEEKMKGSDLKFVFEL